MDETYLKFAQSLMNLGEAFESVCRVVAPNNPKIAPVRARARQFVQFGNALTHTRPTAAPWVVSVAELASAAARLDSARVQLLDPRMVDPNQLRVTVLSINAALSDVLPGIPDLPDLPKPEAVPPEDVVDLVITTEEGRSSDTEDG